MTIQIKKRLNPNLMAMSLCALFAAPVAAELEEIVVTAQKRSESVQDVPISITAITGEELVQRGLTDFTEIAQSVANFD